MTKDVFEFPVVGMNYIKSSGTIVDFLEEGDVLKLEADPENIFDVDAIKVISLKLNKEIGYVPNKGYSCRHCWEPAPANEDACPKCNQTWDYNVKGGLATRLAQRKCLTKNYACFIFNKDSSNKYAPVTVKLIVE